MPRSGKTFILVSHTKLPCFYLNFYSPTLRIATPEQFSLLQHLYSYDAIATIARVDITPRYKFCALYSSEGDPLFYFLDAAGVPHYYAGLA